MARQKNRPFIILLIGVTGAGKSTFASHASGTLLEIGHDLDPCTQDPQAVNFRLNDHEIFLIDTPGLDDSGRNDVQILGDIAQWIDDQTDLKNQTIDGLILLHPVNRSMDEEGVNKDERRRTRLLEKLLGEDAYSRVIVGTTMWSNFSPDYAEVLEEELTKDGNRLGKGGVWGELLSRGATIQRHDNTKESAHRIIQQIISRSSEGMTQQRRRKVTANNNRTNVISLGPSFFKQLVEDLEEELADCMQDLVDHREEEPALPFRGRADPETLARWKDWDAHRQEIARRVEQREVQLKRLRRVLVSAPLSDNDAARLPYGTLFK